jgi:hypothetical protein
MLGYEGVDLLKFNYSSLAAAKRASKGVWAGARADGVSFSVDHATHTGDQAGYRRWSVRSEPNPNNILVTARQASLS